MSRSGEVELAWNGGTHDFRLAIGEWRRLQEACDCGPADLLERLTNGRWRINDLREPIRLGLIGGGMKPIDANALVEQWVDARPFLENLPVARAIVLASLVGAPEEPLGNGAAAEAASEATDVSPSPQSMVAAP